MTTRPDPPVIDRDDPTLLLGLLEAFPDSVVVGFEPSDDHVDLHIAPLPPDTRSGAAGLIGMRASHEWSAVGVALVGRARQLDTRTVVGTTAHATVVVTRQGRLASRLHVDGADAADAADGAGGSGDGRAARDRPEGVAVDALHRMLGLPCPGDPPAPAELALAMWCHEVLQVLLHTGTITWSQALALHPGDAGRGPVGPSDEMLVESTVRFADGFRWHDFHDRASRGLRSLPDLDAGEAAWMDTTMFARWIVASLADPPSTVRILRQHGCAHVADRIDRVAGGVTLACAG